LSYGRKKEEGYNDNDRLTYENEGARNRSKRATRFEEMTDLVCMRIAPASGLVRDGIQDS